MTINLIPPKLKQEKEFKKSLSLILIFLIIVLFMLLVVSGTIYFANYSLVKNLDNTNAKISEQTIALKQYVETEDKIEAINSKLVKIDKANGDKILWSSILQELSAVTPVNVQIKTLSANQDGMKISLTGVAETRRDIAKLKEKMESSKFFKDVKFSTSAYKSDTNNYSFDLSSTLEATK